MKYPIFLWTQSGGGGGHSKNYVGGGGGESSVESWDSPLLSIKDC